ncbi:hypothetical protein JZ751_011643 [Albula glossodonta]|uniref:Uncharacterized protein n=1 Tax=Albula glossodonta TaxID=121402 RepID=A0A8T2PQ81_9TELE|nr:hypothetical protein JZ751_011643 [Albula glossodonta]
MLTPKKPDAASSHATVHRLTCSVILLEHCADSDWYQEDITALKKYEEGQLKWFLLHSCLLLPIACLSEEGASHE